MTFFLLLATASISYRIGDIMANVEKISIALPADMATLEGLLNPAITHHAARLSEKHCASAMLGAPHAQMRSVKFGVFGMKV